MEAGTPGRNPAEHPERHRDDLECFGLGVVATTSAFERTGTCLAPAALEALSGADARNVERPRIGSWGCTGIEDETVIGDLPT